MGGSSQITRAVSNEREQLRQALYDRQQESPTLVTLKRGSQEVPIFLAPGLGNDMRDLYELANLLDVPNAVHGLQQRGSNGVAEPDRTLPAMAETHLADIRTVQPKGPYLLIGYSLGGLVMLEIAQRLRALGEEVRLLAMLDSYPHRSCLPFSEWFPLMIRLARHKLLHGIGIVHGHEAARNVTRDPDTVDLALARVEAAQDAAWYAYRPSYYAGLIRYVETAEKMEYFARHPRAVWARWAGEMTVACVPGNHVQILNAHAPEVAALLSSYIREAGL